MGKGKSPAPDGPKGLQNRKARHDYVLEDSFEAGMVLVGSEVKSLFYGRGNLTDAYCLVRGGELWILNLDIEPYDKAAAFLPERRRDRKLLMHRREIVVLDRKAQEKGYALIPTRVYFKNGKAKLEICLGRGRKQYDKRDKIAADEARREAQNLRTRELD